MNKNITNPPRLVIYGIGQYGSHVAHFAVEKGWPIVAAYNRAGDKVGQDLGRVIGLDYDLGVIIEDCDLATYENLEADIGIVAQTNLLQVNFVAYERLMNAGLNVLCHGSQSYYPFANNPDVAQNIDKLAKRKGVTFTGSGIWDMSRLWAGILVAGPCTRIDSMFHSSITDVTRQAIDYTQAKQVGLGMTVEQFEQSGLPQSPLLTYGTVPVQVLDALGFSITKTNTKVEPVLFDKPVENPYTGEMIPSGICVGCRIVGEVSSHEGVSARAEVEVRLFRENEVEHMFWSVNGLPESNIRTERKDSAQATAACLFNRIPDVLAAIPGIVMVTEMGPLKHTTLTKNA